MLKSECDFAECQHIAGADGRTLHARAVDERPVARTEITNGDPGLGAIDLGVTSRDGGVDDRNVARGRAADDERCARAQLEAENTVGGDQLEGHANQKYGSSRGAWRTLFVGYQAPGARSGAQPIHVPVLVPAAWYPAPVLTWPIAVNNARALFSCSRNSRSGMESYTTPAAD